MISYSNPHTSTVPSLTSIIIALDILKILDTPRLRITRYCTLYEWKKAISLFRLWTYKRRVFVPKFIEERISWDVGVHCITTVQGFLIEYPCFSSNQPRRWLLTPSNWSALYRGGGSPVMSWILLKANNGQQASGVGDKRFFCFKRNAYHLWTAIIRHRLNDITHQQVMRLNQASKFANIFEVHLKHPQCFGTLAQPCHFLLNTPVMTQRIFPGPARVEWLWVNDIGPMNTIYGTGDPALVDMWRTSHQNMKYQS